MVLVIPSKMWILVLVSRLFISSLFSFDLEHENGGLQLLSVLLYPVKFFEILDMIVDRKETIIHHLFEWRRETIG